MWLAAWTSTSTGAYLAQTCSRLTVSYQAWEVSIAGCRGCDWRSHGAAASSVASLACRLLAEEDVAAGPEASASRPLAAAAGPDAEGLYRAGDVAGSGLGKASAPGSPPSSQALAMYLIRRAGMFPDTCEGLAEGHLSRDDRVRRLGRGRRSGGARTALTSRANPVWRVHGRRRPPWWLPSGTCATGTSWAGAARTSSRRRCTGGWGGTRRRATWRGGEEEGAPRRRVHSRACTRTA